MPASLHANVNEALAAMGPGITHGIFHRGDATGDIPHVLAAMANNAHLGVVVMDGAGTAPIGLAKVANVMVDHFGASQLRVKFVSCLGPVPSPPKAGHAYHVGGRVFTMYPLTKSTNILRDDLAELAIKPLVFKNVKAALRGGTLHTADITGEGGAPHVGVIDLNFLDPQCAAFWIDNHIHFDRSTVVLWGRESGRVGGMHPDHDHSYTGMQQIVQRCGAHGPPYQVIVAGDYRATNEHGVATATRQAIAANATVIGKFWDADDLFKDRFNQVRLFYVLKKMLKVRNCRMVHVGMRSGGLDMFGFSGQKAVYVSRAAGDDRMAPVAALFDDLDMGDTYQKHTAERLPKRGPHHAGKGGRTKAQRGYTDTDLDTLMGEINTALA